MMVVKGRRQTLLVGKCSIQIGANNLKDQGFTLIELLVVIVIVGILAVATVMNVNNSSADLLEREAQRLHALIRQIEEDAILGGKELGISFSKENEAFQYSFFEYDYSDQAWKPMSNNYYRTRFLPDFVTLVLETDEQNLLFGANDNSSVPNLYFFSSGEKSQYSLLLADSSLRFLIHNDGINDSQLSQLAQ